MKVKLCCTSSYTHHEISDVIEVPDTTTDDELLIMAREFMEFELNPEYWFEKVNKEKKEYKNE